MSASRPLFAAAFKIGVCMLFLVVFCFLCYSAGEHIFGSFFCFRFIGPRFSGSRSLWCVVELPRCVPFIPASIVRCAGAPRAHQHRPGGHSRGHGFGQRGWKLGKRAHLPSGTCTAWQTVSTARSTHPVRTNSARSDRRRTRVTVVVMCPHQRQPPCGEFETKFLMVP